MNCRITELFGIGGRICSCLFGFYTGHYDFQRGDYRAIILFDNDKGFLGLGYDYILNQIPDYESLLPKFFIFCAFLRSS